MIALANAILNYVPHKGGRSAGAARALMSPLPLACQRTHHARLPSFNSIMQLFVAEVLFHLTPFRTAG
jgi:hypothetical protein